MSTFEMCQLLLYNVLYAWIFTFVHNKIVSVEREVISYPDK